MHPVITEADFRRQIGKTAGNAYLFFGEEDYLKLHALRLVRESVSPDPTFAVFNDIIIDGTDYTPDGLLNAMTPPPMMADGRLILLRGLDFNSMKPSELDGLVETLALLPEYDFNTVVVHVAAGNIDEGRLPKTPSATFKKLAEVATPVQFSAVSESRLITCAGKHFAHLGVQATPVECSFLIGYAGPSMFLLASEIEKLAYYVRAAGRDRVSVEDIRIVSVPQISTDAFALSNAVMAGKYRDALDVLAAMRFQRVEPTVILGELSRTFCEMHGARVLLDAGKSAQEIAQTLGRIHEYKAKLLIKAVSGLSVARLSRAIELCAATDVTLKSVKGMGDYATIEKLICSL